MPRPLLSLARALTLSLALTALTPCLAGEDPKPIVDIRIDAPYKQIDTSMGDEWAPTWAPDDTLYTANDDGTSFGGVPLNAIAFGKLQGTTPDTLTGHTVNGMPDYREPEQAGPAGAQWKTTASVKLDTARYRLAPCATTPTKTCLLRSTADSKSWTSENVLQPAVVNDPKFNAPTFITYNPDTEAELGGKVGEYLYAASYAGVQNGTDVYTLGRVPKTKLLHGNPTDWTFQGSDFGWGSLDKAAPAANSTYLGPDGANWKTMNAYSVDGVLYQFITRCTYPSGSNDPKHRHTWRNSTIIKSLNQGRTWSPPAPTNYTHPMFPGRRFGAPYFVWYGKDGAATTDNADRYVYAVSNNGFFENGDDYVLGRVLKTKLSHLSGADWSFYKSGDGMLDAGWTAKLDDARPILTHPGKSSMTGMTYIEGLHRYVMTVWHYHKDNFEQGIRDHDLGTIVEFFEAGKPWGPWTLVKSIDTGTLGWYTPIVGQRFQTTVDANSVKAILYATGFFTRPQGGLDMTLYKLNYMPITLSTQPLQHRDPAFAGGR